MGMGSDEERRQVDVHLVECQRCRDAFDDVQRDTIRTNDGVRSETVDIVHTESVEILAGDAVSRYRVRRRIGGGGMGVVYDAHDPLLDRRVALKVLRSDIATDSMHARMLREAQALARLTHPNVVAV